MSINRTRRSAATVIAAGMLAVAGLALASPASAQPKPPPQETAGCTYAGGAYSHGSVRQQVVHHGNNNPDTYENYECKNGSWVFTGTALKAHQPSMQLPSRPPITHG